MIKERTISLNNNVVMQTRSCADLAAIAKQLQGTIYTRLGSVNPKDLDPQLRGALSMTGPGEAVKPFFSPAGLEFILRCDGVLSKVGAFELPSREQLQQQLFVQQMSLYAKSYLRDLRRNAIVYATGR